MSDITGITNNPGYRESVASINPVFKGNHISRVSRKEGAIIFGTTMRTSHFIDLKSIHKMIKNH